jgi:hypothetical protein
MPNAPTRSMRPRMRPKAKETTRPLMRPSTQEEREAGERGNRASELEAKHYADGGMVRGCGPAQMSGTAFRGEY